MSFRNAEISALVDPDLDENELMTAVADMNDEHRKAHGWDSAVNLVTPIHYRDVPRRAATFWALQRSWAVQATRRTGLLHIRPVEDQLRRLNHLHVARWSLVSCLPSVGAALPENKRYTLLLFTSHFDAGWRRYLGTFIETTSNGLAHLWGNTPSWRFPTDGSRQFENFVVDQQVPHEHLFAAFPNLSSNEILTALRLCQEMDAQNNGHDNLLGLPPCPARDLARARARLRRLQYCLGTLPDPQYNNLPTDARAVDVDERDYSITALVPYAHHNEKQLREALQQLDFGHKSPFAKIPGTHFARFALIGDDYFLPRSVPPLQNGYLLFSAEFDGSRDTWLRRLAQQEELRDVWRLCHGDTSPENLPRLLMHCRIRPSLEFINYPNATVAKIDGAVRAHSGLVKKLRTEASQNGGKG